MKKEPTMPALPTGLVRHKNGTYYLRRRIPNDLLAHYPPKKEQESWSLRVSNYRDAVEIFYIEDAKLQAKWRHMRQRRADFFAARQFEALQVLTELSPDDIDRIAHQVESEALAGDERRREEGHYDISDIEEYRQGYSAALPELKAAVAVGDVSVLAPLLKQFLYLHRYEDRLSDADFRRLAIAYGRAAIRVNEMLLRRYDGEHIPTPSAANQKQIPFRKLVDKYLASYAKGDTPAMAKKVNLVLPMLLESVGNRSIHTIKQSDINRFFELVQNLAPHWKYEAKKRRVSWVELAKLELGELSPGTFEDTYRSVVTRFLKWSITNWQDQGFPTTLTTELIKYDGSRKGGESHQRAFRISEIKRLLAGPEMQAFAADLKEQHKFWLPHLGLFTGARVNELCQLNPHADFHLDEDSGRWYFKITEETETAEGVTKTVKTQSSTRNVPIHSGLVELGFLDYVAAQKKRKRKLLFSPFKPSRGRASGEAEKWFRGFLTDTGLRDETPGEKLVGMHAFRSTFLNRAMNLHVANAAAISGHTTKAEAEAAEKETSHTVRVYQGEMSVGAKSKILEQIVWPDLKLIKPVKPTV